MQQLSRRIAAIFDEFNWKWWSSGEYPPSAKEIRETIAQLINSIERRNDEDSYWSSTGRILVMKMDDDYEVFVSMGSTNGQYEDGFTELLGE